MSHYGWYRLPRPAPHSGTPHPMPADPLTVEEVEALTANHFEESFLGGRHRAAIARSARTPAELVLDCTPLTADDVALVRDYAAAPVPLHPPVKPISVLRHTHHRLAQLLAHGTRPSTAAAMCGFTANYVGVLQADPAFQELLAHYAADLDEVWAEFHEVASGLTLDAMHRMRELLDAEPEKFTPAIALETIKVLADRTGHAPVSRTVNMNVSVDMAERLKRAKARVAQSTVVEGERLDAPP